MKCVICGNANPKIVKFTKEIFDKYVNIVKFRQQKGLKYSDLAIPSDFNDNGYHASCYKKITALSKQYRQSFESLIKTPGKELVKVSESYYVF